MKVVINVNGIDPADPRLSAAAPGATFVRPSAETLLDEVAECEVIFGGGRLPEILPVARSLRWLHSASAGMELFVEWTRDYPDLLLTSSAGVYDQPIAEHALGLLLALRRQIGVAVRASVESRWERLPTPIEITGRTLGIVGLGSIGRATAKIAKLGFGMRVLGHRRRETGPVDHVDALYHGRDGLLAMLPECDQVLVAAALTPATRHLLDADALDQLPPHAVVLNIARGAIIDEAALIERLRDGRLAGAGLDVFEHEPLSAESPLWSLPQVVITPHNAGWSDRVHEHRLRLFCTQLRRYLAGEPLLNQVDRAAGY